MTDRDTSTDKKISAAWLTSPAVQKLVHVLHTEDRAQVRFVGGCVRNAVLKEPVADVDLATPLQPDIVAKRLEEAGIRVIPTGIEHGTVTALVDGETFEITTLRSDVSTDGRRATVAFTQDWAEDAQRRDFTMNAMYADPDGALFDPVGGYADALARRLRFIGDPVQRIQEDYLRILRFFRFYATYSEGEPDADGLAACASEVSGLRQLSGERVQGELLKLLATDRAVPTLRYMAAAGVLAEVLPEAREFDLLAKLIELESTQLFTSDDVLRLCALLGPDTDVIKEVAGRLRLSNAVKERMLRIGADKSKIACYLSMREVRRLLYRLGKDLFKDRVMLEWSSDSKASNGVQWRALLAMADTWEKPRFPLTGEQVKAAGVPEGPEIGRVMAEVEEWWIDSDFIEDEFSIIERLKAIVQATVL